MTATTTRRPGHRRGGPRPQRRFPTAPLETWLAVRGVAATEQHPQGSQRGLARFLGVDPGQWQRWRSEGVPTFAADRLACRAGLHPSLLWPDWFDEETP